MHGAPADDPGRSSTSEPLSVQPDIRSLTLIASTSGRSFMVSNVDHPVLIGRRDDARGIYPGVDLGAEGGYEAGVSRKHATLTQHQGMYYIEDLGSANGTFVNGRQIAPRTPTSIAHGDELRCGMLRLHIEIK
jgi:pSer/pThr/pTyr-binding forkhead associated (FHA) protein